MSELSREEREQFAPYWTGPVGDIYVLQGHQLAAMLDQARAEALERAADDWQQGQWADAPRRADRIEERIANAQHVTDWLRNRAARHAGADQ